MLEENIKENDEIELMDLFLVLWRRKWIIIGVVFFSMLMAFFFITFQQEQDLRTEMVVSLDFMGIDKGLYPDGTTFDSKDIVSPYLLSKLDFDRDLSGCIFVEELIPGYIKKKISKNPSFVYYPDRFKIVLVEHENELFDSNKERADVLKAIAKIFRTIFEKKFIEESAFSFQFPDNFIQGCEYDDIIYIFQRNIDLIEEFLMQKEEDVRAFRSQKNGYSFSEILSELFILKQIDLKNIISKIRTFSYAKDKQGLIIRLQDDIKNIEYERLKNEKRAEISFELLKTVKSNKDPTQGGKTIGSGQSNKQFIVDSSVLDRLIENDYVFYLIKSNLDTKTNAINNSLAIAKLKDRLEGLENDGIKSKINDNKITGQLRSIQNKIIEIAKKADNLNYEYLESKVGKTIHINNFPEYIINYKYKSKLIFLMAFAGSLLLGLFLSFLVDYVIRYRKDN